jgi:hypothetical protein
MKVYVFGNKDVPEDKKAIEVAERLEDAIEGVSLVFVGPNEDVPFLGERHAIILDTVRGIQDVALIEGDEIDAFVLSVSLGSTYRNFSQAAPKGRGVKYHVPRQPEVRRSPPHRGGLRTPAPVAASGRLAWQGCSPRGCARSWR